MVNRLVSVGDDFKLPAAVKVENANLPAALQPASLTATYASAAAVTGKLDKTEAATTYAPMNTTALAGSTVIGYGHSYVEGVGATGQPFINQFGTLIGAASTINRGIGGASMIKTLHAISNGTRQWNPGTKALVVLDSVYNDLFFTSSANADQDRVGFENALRSSLRILRAGSWVDHTDASVTRAGTWVGDFGGAEPRGGLAWNTVNTDATVTISGYVPRDIVIMGFCTAGAQSAFELSVGGTVYGGLTVTGGLGATSGGITPGYQLQAYRFTGLPAGAKTILLSHKGAPAGSGGNNAWFFDGYLTPPEAPPTIMVVRDAPLTSYPNTPHTKAAGDALLNKLNAVVSRVVAEPEFGGPNETRVVDAGIGYNPVTMTGAPSADALHRNQLGHTVLAETLRRDAVNIPYRPGIF